MKLSWFVSVMLLFWMLSNIIMDITPSNVGVREVYTNPSWLPSDGDNWTENDNATYPWTVVSPYIDAIEFQTGHGVTNGSYALKVTNMAGTYFRFRLALPSDTDVSSYEFFTLYYTTNATVDDKYFDFKWLDGTAYYRMRFYIDNLSSGRIVIPLDAFGCYGSPNWNSVNKLEINYGPFGDADCSTIYIDGLHFTTEEIVSSTSYDLDYYTRPFYRQTSVLEQAVVESNTSYTSIWAYANSTSGESVEVESSIENEALAHSIFALSFAYNHTKSSLILEKLNNYGNWLYRMYACPESNNTYYGGTLDYYTNASQGWADEKSDTCNGWVLQAASVLYSVTQNATYKTLADSTAYLFTETLWDATNNWFDRAVKPSNGTITDATSWNLMSQSAPMGGLWAYSYLVEKNTTMEAIAQKCYDSMPTTAMGYYNVYYFGSSPLYYETFAYFSWAKYWGWKATGNATYHDYCKPEQLLLAHVMADEFGTQVAPGRIPYVPFDFWSIESDVKRDDWGASCSALLLAVKLIESPSTAYERAFERMLLNYFKDATTSGWLFPRMPNSGNVWEWQTWNGQLPFYLASYLLYLHEIEQLATPYVLASDGEVISQTYVAESLTLTLDGIGATTTEVCCGNKGKPRKVFINNNEYKKNDDWTYDPDTGIFTFTWTYSSIATVQIRWKRSAHDLRSLHIKVTKDGQPTDAIINLNGQNRSIFFKTLYQLSCGKYEITAYCEGERQTKEISLYSNTKTGFNFGAGKKRGKIP